MKSKLHKLTKHMLTATMAFFWWISFDCSSNFLFGEIPYPEKED